MPATYYRLTCEDNQSNLHRLRVCFLILSAFVILGVGQCHAQNFFRVDWRGLQGTSYQSRAFSTGENANKFMDSLSKEFRSLGFLMLSWEEIKKNDTLTFKLETGKQHSWKEVKQGNVPDEWWKKLGSPPDFYLGPYVWMETLVKSLENEGFPFASIKIDSLMAEDNLLNGVYKLDNGPLILWDSLTVSGESKTTQKYLQLYSGLVPGKPFSQKQFESGVRRISRSPYFQLDSIPYLGFQIKRATPHFKLRDRRINVFDGVVGLIPNQNQPNSMLLTGDINLQLYHLGGKGRDIALQWQRPNFQSQNLNLSAKESYLFGSPLSFQLDFSLLKQDTSFVNRSVSFEFGYSISESGKIRFFNKRQAGDLIGGFGSAESLPAYLDYRWNSYGFGVNWNWLDDPIFTRKGSKIQAEFSVGNKNLIENTAIPGEAYQGLDKSSTQLQAKFQLEKHVFLNSLWGMWLRMNTGMLKNENLFLNELSRLGGLKSLRGFNEMYFFADRYALFTMEQRLFFGKGSYLMAFGDLGIINNPFISPRKDLPRSFGLGINLDTDGGLFSFVFGMGKSAFQPVSISQARIHFGYLARF